MKQKTTDYSEDDCNNRKGQVESSEIYKVAKQTYKTSLTFAKFIQKKQNK